MQLFYADWKHLSCCFAALCLSPAVAMGQQPIELPGITVEGATLETPRERRRSPATTASQTPSAPAPTPDEGTSEGGVPANQIGAAVTVITGEDLRRQQVRYAVDALRSLPGVSVSRTGNSGGLTQVRIRGAEGNHTLVVIDGIEANSTTNGEFDFSNLSAEDIERIEVIRGPMSGIYGSNAVGGVINIVTRRGRGPLTATLQTEIGSFNTQDIVARLSGGSDKEYFSASYHYRGTDGFNIAPAGSEKDGSMLSAFSLRAGAKFTKDLSADFVIHHTNKRADIDGYGDPFAPNGTLATAYDLPSKQYNTTFLAGAKVRWDMLDGRLSHEFRANYNSSDMNNVSPGFNNTNASLAHTLSYLATYRFETPGGWARHSVSALLDRGEESFTPLGSFTDGIERTRSRLSLAGEWRGDFGRTVFVTANVRHDDNDVFDDFTTWRSAVSIPLEAVGIRPHASVGTAVKFPTMFEQFGSIPLFFTPNPNLSPERSFGWDAGVEFTIVKKVATVDVTYFSSDLKDKIDGLAPGPNFTFTAVNLPGTSRNQGVEVAARFQLLPNLGLGLAYTYTDATNPDGSKAVRRPPHAGRIDLDYGFAGGRGSARLGAIYNGRMDDNTFLLQSFAAAVVGLDEYWVVTAAASYKLQPGVELFGRVENVLDAKYQEVYGYNTPGLAAYTGVKLTFGGPEGVGGSWAK